MDSTYYTTETRKGQHLLREERYEIEIRRRDGWSIYKIAKHLGRAYNTVKAKIERGTVDLYNGKVKRYKADQGERVYRENRQSSRRKYKCLETAEFLRYVITHFKGENKKNLGRSIEERPESVENRDEFGHWETDTVIGKKDENEPCVVVMNERKTRVSIWVKARNHTADAINEAIDSVMSYFSEKQDEVFKTITADNGSEFAKLSLLENGKLKVYFTHPYSSFEKGTVECHNKMLRRFIPKGKRIADYTADQICFFADCINGLPRRILGYRTPEALFDAQLDRIYAL